MRRNQINARLWDLAFDFFSSFSRFEFCLKKNQYLKSHGVKKNASPDWSLFCQKWENQYKISEAAIRILEHPPNEQVVGEGLSLEWHVSDLSKYKNELSQVVALLKIIRNNLFHGGKHVAGGWDDPKRAEILIGDSLIILRELVELANFSADFDQLY